MQKNFARNTLPYHERARFHSVATLTGARAGPRRASARRAGTRRPPRPGGAPGSNSDWRLGPTVPERLRAARSRGPYRTVRYRDGHGVRVRRARPAPYRPGCGPRSVTGRWRHGDRRRVLPVPRNGSRLPGSDSDSDPMIVGGSAGRSLGGYRRPRAGRRRRTRL
eukprot:199202-Hanusia_phi.AAC.6